MHHPLIPSKCYNDPMYLKDCATVYYTMVSVMSHTCKHRSEQSMPHSPSDPSMESTSSSSSSSSAIVSTALPPLPLAVVASLPSSSSSDSSILSIVSWSSSSSSSSWVEALCARLELSQCKGHYFRTRMTYLVLDVLERGLGVASSSSSSSGTMSSMKSNKSLRYSSCRYCSSSKSASCSEYFLLTLVEKRANAFLEVVSRNGRRCGNC